MRRVIALAAPAKINVTLEVLGKRADGYHDIRSVFVRLPKLADVIEMRIEPGATAIRISTNCRDIPTDETNICHVAVSRYLDAVGETARAEIHIDKKIPVAAGLGGGSSDSASVLLAFNEWFGRRMKARQLMTLAAEIGKDVPFFLRGCPCAYVSGAGEIVRALPVFPRVHWLLVNPGVAVSTRRAFEMLDQQERTMNDGERANVSSAMEQAIKAQHVASAAGALYNDFEPLIERLHPIVKELKQALLALGAHGALMSGSGATVFGFFEARPALRSAEAALRKKYPGFFIANA